MLARRRRREEELACHAAYHAEQAGRVVLKILQQFQKKEAVTYRMHKMLLR